MDSANNSSSLQSSSGGGGGDEEFNSHSFFTTTNPKTNHHNIGISIDNNINNIISSSINSGMIRNASIDNLPLPDLAFSFFDQASSASSSFPLLPNPNPNPINPPTKTTPAPAPRTNPRKRSRASRRAPTTVMTTDTSNFRAMVQEFTGIPSPPFLSSSYPSRPRLGFSAPPSFLMKPYPQKQIQISPAVHLQASRSTANYGGLINDYRMHPSTSNFQSLLLQSQHLDDDSAVAGLGQPTSPIGSGWNPAWHHG